MTNEPESFPEDAPQPVEPIGGEETIESPTPLLTEDDTEEVSPVLPLDIPETGEVPPSPPAEEPSAPSLPLPPPPGLGSVLGYGLLCGLVGILASLKPFATATLPHILTPDGLSFQTVLEGLPVPKLLDWNTMQIGLLQQLRDINPILLIPAALLLFGFLFARTLRVLFPTLHLFHRMPVVSGGEAALASTDDAPLALDGTLLSRLAAQFLLVALPLALLNGLAAATAERFPKTGVPLTIVWCLLAGIWLRTVLRPGGIVARGMHLTGASTHRRHSVSHAREIGLGAVFGLLLYGLQATAMRLPSQNVLNSLHALGTFHVARWHALGWHYLLSVGLACFGAGLLFLLFAPLHTRPFPKAAAALLVVLSAPLALWLQRPYAPPALLSRWDISATLLSATASVDLRYPMSAVPDGAEAARKLAQLAGIPQGKQAVAPDHRFLLFAKNGPIISLQHGYTEDGLSADPTTVPKVEAFLRRRDNNTALSWTAFKHLYNVGNVHFDTTQALRACLDDLERYPHSAIVTRAIRDSLFTVAASPQNLAILNEWADEKHFTSIDRASLKLMGDLYLRFGEKEKALAWYTRADMPRSFMAERRADKPLFHDGEITGTLLWNGKPLVGVQVGAFPHLQNGLPKDLEGPVRDAERSLLPNFPFSEQFGIMEPRPYEFRWMSAGTVTDSAGHFALPHLTEGTYHLICTLPADVILKPFQDDRLHIVNGPVDINIRYPTHRHPGTAYDQGKIELTFKP